MCEMATHQSGNQPIVRPSGQAAIRPSGQAARQPSSQAAIQPGSHPARQPSSQAARQPGSQAARQPGSQEARQPGSHRAPHGFIISIVIMTTIMIATIIGYYWVLVLLLVGSITVDTHEYYCWHDPASRQAASFMAPSQSAIMISSLLSSLFV